MLRMEIVVENVNELRLSVIPVATTASGTVQRGAAGAHRTR